jgi:hypothetical protein
VSVWVRPYRAGDAFLVGGSDPLFLADADDVARAGSSWTLVQDGAEVAIGGMRELWANVAFGWLQYGAAPISAAGKFALARAAFRAVRGQTWRRLQCSVDVGDDAALDFAIRLGFEAEGVLRAYAPDGADHLALAIIRGGGDVGS